MVYLPEPTCPYQQIPCASVHAGDIEPLDMFFAYASEPQRRVDAIRGAIEIIQGDSALGCKIADWTDLPIEGNVIFCAICEAIRNARCVATDITGLNFNVLFELGFAIGAGRAIWPLVESSEEVSRAERNCTSRVSTSSDYVRVMDQRLCQWLLCQANSYPVR